MSELDATAAEQLPSAEEVRLFGIATELFSRSFPRNYCFSLPFRAKDGTSFCMTRNHPEGLTDPQGNPLRTYLEQGEALRVEVTRRTGPNRDLSNEWVFMNDGKIICFTYGQHVEGMTPIGDKIIDTASRSAAKVLELTNDGDTSAEDRELMAKIAANYAAIDAWLETRQATDQEVEFGMNGLRASDEQLADLSSLLTEAHGQSLPTVIINPDAAASTDVGPRQLTDSGSSFQSMLDRVRNMLDTDE